MTQQFPSRPAPSWMQEHRGKVLAALAGALTATLAIAGAATWDAFDIGEGSDSRSITAPLTPSYPASRDGVRGHVDSDPGTLGVTSDPIQPSSREPNYPASRDGLRGHVDN